MQRDSAMEGKKVLRINQDFVSETEITFRFELGTTVLNTPRIDKRLIDDCRMRVADLVQSPFGKNSELRTLGGLLYSWIIVPNDAIAQLYRSIKSSVSIGSNEEGFPWEILYDGQEFLGISLRVGRQPLLKRNQALSSHLTPSDDLGVFLFGNPDGSLPDGEIDAMLSEFKPLAKHFQWLVGAACRKTTICAHLNEHWYDLVHYTGHVCQDDSTRSYLPTADMSEMLLCQEISDLCGWRKSGKRPIVFVNGCESAGLESIVLAFVEGGARAAIGTIHSPADVTAKAMAVATYAELIRGVSIGEALRLARQELARSNNAGWGSYILYGDPNERLVSLLTKNEHEELLNVGLVRLFQKHRSLFQDLYCSHYDAALRYMKGKEPMPGEVAALLAIGLPKARYSNDAEKVLVSTYAGEFSRFVVDRCYGKEDAAFA